VQGRANTSVRLDAAVKVPFSTSEWCFWRRVTAAAQAVRCTPQKTAEWARLLEKNGDEVRICDSKKESIFFLSGWQGQQLVCSISMHEFQMVAMLYYPLFDGVNSFFSA